MTRAFVLLFLLTQADGRRVASVDLTVVPKDQSFGPASEAVRVGRVFGPSGYLVPHHSPLSLSVKILDFAGSSNPAPWSVALDVAVTNTGTQPVQVPVGADGAKLLAPSAKSRRFLSLAIWTVGDRGKATVVGGGRAASNDEDPQSAIELSPGEYVVYRIGTDTRGQGLSDCVRNAGDGGCHVTVMVNLNQRTLDHGTDYSEPISDPISAVNALKWAPPHR